MGSASELHLFIIWEFAREREKDILDDIEQSFTIHKVFEVHWSKKNFANNMTRFYGEKLPPNSYKEEHVGRGPFLLVVVEDVHAEYAEHDTTRGKEVVNSRLFLSKAKHREWTGGGSRVHATNSEAETDHDLTLLLGLNSKDFLKKYPKPSTKPETYKHDLIGADGWESLEQLLYVCNSTFEYVVMRNFAPLPDKYYADDHGDIDLLVRNFQEASYIMNTKKVFKEDFRVHVSTKIQKEDVLFDLRFIGDNYYAQSWEEDILQTRVLSKKGFYVPQKAQHLNMLIYHAFIHKLEVAQDYRDQFAAHKPSLRGAGDKKLLTNLARFMRKNNYGIVKPDDHSVIYNEEHVQRLGEQVSKRPITPRRVAGYAKRRAKKFLNLR